MGLLFPPVSEKAKSVPQLAHRDGSDTNPQMRTEEMQGEGTSSKGEPMRWMARNPFRNMQDPVFFVFFFSGENAKHHQAGDKKVDVFSVQPLSLWGGHRPGSGWLLRKAGLSDMGRQQHDEGVSRVRGGLGRG